MDNSLQPAAEEAIVFNREPLLKSCRPTGPEPCLVATLPPTLGVEAPFGLTTVPAETHPTDQQASNFPSHKGLALMHRRTPLQHRGLSPLALQAHRRHVALQHNPKFSLSIPLPVER